MGIIKLIQEIQKSILNQSGMNISEEQVEMLLSGDDAVVFDESIKSIVETKAEEYANSLLDRLTESGFELKLNPNVVIGGGGLLIRRFIENNSRVKYVEFLDQFANAKSYKALMELALKRR
jgi:plasmid segregation protein ParM